MQERSYDELFERSDAIINGSTRRSVFLAFIAAFTAAVMIFSFSNNFNFLYNAFNTEKYDEGRYSILSGRSSYTYNNIDISVTSYYVSEEHISVALSVKTLDKDTYMLNESDLDVFVFDGIQSRRCQFERTGTVLISPDASANVMLSVNDPPPISENSLISVVVNIPGTLKRVEFLLNDASKERKTQDGIVHK